MKYLTDSIVFLFRYCSLSKGRAGGLSALFCVVAFGVCSLVIGCNARTDNDITVVEKLVALHSENEQFETRDLRINPAVINQFLRTSGYIPIDDLAFEPGSGDPTAKKCTKWKNGKRFCVERIGFLHWKWGREVCSTCPNG